MIDTGWIETRRLVLAIALVMIIAVTTGAAFQEKEVNTIAPLARFPASPAPCSDDLSSLRAEIESLRKRVDALENPKPRFTLIKSVE